MWCFCDYNMLDLSAERGHSVLQDANFTTSLELAVRFGKTLVIQEMDGIEPILYPLLRGDLISQGIQSHFKKSFHHSFCWAFTVNVHNSLPGTLCHCLKTGTYGTIWKRRTCDRRAISNSPLFSQAAILISSAVQTTPPHEHTSH